MRLAPTLGLILASAALAQNAQQDPSTVVPYKISTFPAFEERVGGSWRVHWNYATGTPDSIYGTGIELADWRQNTLEEARRHAHQALADHADVLQLGASEFREIIGARMGRTWSFVFDQYFRGLPCIEGRADVRINMKGVIAKLGSTAWQVPADFDITPVIDPVVAEAQAWLTLGDRRSTARQPGAAGAPRLVIWGDVNAADLAPIHLAWEVPVSNVDAVGNGKIGRYYIDARSGETLHFTNDKHQCGNPACTHPAHRGTPAPAALTPTTVTVMCWTRTGLSATSALVNVPVPGLSVAVPGIGTVITDANGQFTVDITAPVTISVAALDGRHCLAVQDTSASLPTGSVTVNPGVAATLQLSSNAAGQAEAAHGSTYYWIDTANEWLRTIVGNTAQMATGDNVLPNVNVVQIVGGQQQFCNAFFSGNSVNFYPAGGGCNNTAFSTVAVHEWGHGLDNWYGGISNAAGDGLSEGWGDIVSMFHPNVDNPVVGTGFFTTGGSIRTGLNTTMYPPPAEVHDAGEVWMGFAWRLRENLRAAFGTPTAILVSNDIVVGSIVADATNQPNAVQEVFLADDNDGNLLNGVPHYAQLSAAAIAKNLPYPLFEPIAISHLSLLDTSVQYVPRLLNATFAPNDGGSVTQARLVYSVAGGAPVTRIMGTDGTANGYRALLPGIASGVISYHLEGTSTTGTTRFPTTGEFSYNTLASGPFTAIFSETFEGTATGWTHVRVSGTATDDWQLGTPNGKSGTSSGVTWADPAAAASSRTYANDLGAGTSNGAYPANMNYYLRSPIINCTGRTGVVLKFRRWLTVEESTFDHAQINVNGTLVWENPVVGHLRDTSWQTVQYLLPMADNNPSVQIEFRLITDGGLQLGGWTIDDVEVGTFAPATPTFAVLQVQPEQATTGTPLTVTVETDEPNEPFVVLYSPFPGPTTVSPFPTVDVGLPIEGIFGTTTFLRLTSFPATAPVGVPAAGLFIYSQVMVLESDGSYSLSNKNFSLFLP